MKGGKLGATSINEKLTSHKNLTDFKSPPGVDYFGYLSRLFFSSRGGEAIGVNSHN